jgi:hypothetical protein
MVRAAAATGRKELTSPQHCFDNYWMMSISPEDEPVQLAGLRALKFLMATVPFAAQSSVHGNSGRSAAADLLSDC